MTYGSDIRGKAELFKYVLPLRAYRNLMEATPSRPGRKKRRVPGEWAQNRRKILRNTGAEYVGVSRKVVQARKSGVDCKCSMECFECVDEQSRQLVDIIIGSLLSHCICRHHNAMLTTISVYSGRVRMKLS